jgi:hypothetical protein
LGGFKNEEEAVEALEATMAEWLKMRSRPPEDDVLIVVPSNRPMGKFSIVADPLKIRSVRVDSYIYK